MRMNEVLVTRRRRMVRFTCHGVPGKPGMAGKLFGALGKNGINVIHMFNAEHDENEGDIAFSVAEKDTEATKAVLESVKTKLGAESITIQPDLAILSFNLEETDCDTVIGNMSTALSALTREHVDVLHIAASSKRVFVVLPDAQAERASAILSRALKEGPIIYPI